MSALVWIVVLGINGAIILFGIWKSRETTSAADWFLAARGLPWWMVGLSMFATAVDSGDYVAVAGESYRNGMSYISAWWIGIGVGWLVVAYLVFLPMYRQGMYTNSEYLEYRFGPLTRLIRVGIQIQYRTNVLGNVAFSLYLVFSALTGWGANTWWLVGTIAAGAAVYTASGGLKSVALTDSLQSIVMMAAAFLLWWSVWEAVGGWSGMDERLTRQSPEIARQMLHVGAETDEGVPGVTLEGNSGLCRYVFQTGVGNTGTQAYQNVNGKPFNTTGSSTVAALRPGDLTLTMSNSGDYIGMTDMNGAGAAHIQSFTINVPLSRTILQRLGSTFGYARVVDFPVDISCTVSAVVSELQASNLFTKLCSKTTHDFTLNMKDSSCTTAGSTKMKFIVKNARLDSETFTNAIGDNESVDMTFTAQIGGANDTSNGLFMEGSYPRYRTLPYWPLGNMKDNETTYQGTPLWLGS